MIDPNVMEAAIAWHIRQRDMAEDGWGAFVAWLEASPAHAGAYDVVASEDGLLAGALAAVPAPIAAPVPRPVLSRAPRPTHRRWGWLAGAGAIAATLAIVAGPLATRGGAHSYVIETRPGEHRTIALADGTQVAMDGGTRLRLDHDDPRLADLEQGQALLRVTHDAANPFTLRSGAVAIQDVGTIFDVTRTGAHLDIAVAEGSVIFRAGSVQGGSVQGGGGQGGGVQGGGVQGGGSVTLIAGRKLSFDETRSQVMLGSVTATDVGGWREDRLGFEGEPLAGVVAAMERRYGTRIALSAGLPDRPFTGMIGLSGSAERDIPHLAALIGVNWRHERGQWTFASQGDGSQLGHTR